MNINIQSLNKRLYELPALKARASEELGMSEIAEKNARGSAFMRYKLDKTVAEAEKLTDSDDNVYALAVMRVKAEARFHQLKDELEACMELARNARAEMRNIDPTVSN